MTAGTAPAKPPLRALRKEARRQAILAAARMLIQGAPNGDFSMPELARAAGVSLVTPYNLFGSKSKILLEIVRDDIFAHAAAIEDIGCDEIALWARTLSERLAALYYAQRHFYRRMVITMVAQESAEDMKTVIALNRGLFEPAVAGMQAAGLLVPGAVTVILADQIALGISAALQYWLVERWKEPRLAIQFELGVLLTLAGMAVDSGRPALVTRIAHLQAVLGANVAAAESAGPPDLRIL